MNKNSEPIWFDEKPEKEKKTYNAKVMVCTPCHSEMSLHYVQSLLELQKMCAHYKIPIEFRFFKSSLVTQGRNLSVAAFLSKEDFTHLLFIDSDISFKPESMLRLLEAEKDLISIPYPLKDMAWDKAYRMMNNGKIKNQNDLMYKGFYRYPMKVKDKNAIKIKKGIIEVTHSPTGFMMISRNCFNQMIEKYPHLEIKQKTMMNGKEVDIENMWNFFDTLHDPETKSYLGEDFAFCKLWMDIGGKCYAYILDRITHVGEFQYTGRFADELILAK